MAVVLTLVQAKHITINIHKRNNTKTQYKQYTVNTRTHYTLANTHTYTHTHTHPHTYKHTHTLQNKLKPPQYKIHTK